MNLAYSEKGNLNAPALVLIHAFPMNRRMWQHQLEDLSDILRVVAPDLPGFGESPGLVEEKSMAAFAREVVLLLDQLSIRKAVFGGCSMGGYILFELWRQAPERFAGMILCDTRCEADSPEARENRMKTIAQIREQGAAPLEAMLAKLICGETAANRKELAEEIRQVILSTQQNSAVDALRALADRPDSSETLAGVIVPALAIVGEKDAVSPPEVVRFMQEKIRGATLAVIPNAGHLSPLENPQAVNGAIREFLWEYKIIGR
ncbi:MAG: alpha/beta fold hydrolase [Candidatus Omnitrophota bacterium]